MDLLVYLAGSDYSIQPDDLISFGFLNSFRSLCLVFKGWCRVLGEGGHAASEAGGTRGVWEELSVRRTPLQDWCHPELTPLLHTSTLLIISGHLVHVSFLTYTDG